MEAAVHKRNLESSILFMQQDHASTLTALHEEVHKLQKKCTDLTFQLTMNGISIDEEGDADTRLKQVQDQLNASRSNESAQEKELALREQRLVDAEKDLRASRKRHLDEMRNAAQTISSLKAEVEAKANNIAYLTTELHRLKVKQKMEVPSNVNAGPPDSTIIRRTQPQHMPAPPRDLLTNSARMRMRGAPQGFPATTVRRPGGNGANPVSVSVSGSSVGSSVEGGAVLRMASASTRSSGSESPDITPFVGGRQVGVKVKKQAPLPPIAAGGLGDRDVRILGIAKHGNRTATVTATTTGRSRARVSAGAEVTTLAVDQVSDANWKRPSESHSSELN